MRRVIVLLVLPLVLIAPTIFTGKLFLPEHPIGLEPLASEHVDEAELAWRDANYLTSDRLFPILTDELEVQRQFRAAKLPLWNAKQGLGLPLFGGTLVGPLYPPNWIAYATDPVRAAPWLAILSLYLLGLGAWLFLERRELSFGACAIGALAAQASGFALINLHYRMKVDAALWLPWALWAVDGIRGGMTSGNRRAALALVASLALSFLAGFPSISIFVAASTALYAILRRFVERERELSLVRSFALIACGTLVASIQLFPTFETSRQSMRAAQSRDELLAQSLPLATSLSIVAPDFFGAPTDRVFAPHLPIAWWSTSKSDANAAQNANLLEWNLFSGLGVVALAIAAVICFRRTAASLALLAIFALGFAQGWPDASWLYYVPGFDLGAPSRAAAVLAVALALLAGFGAEALIRRHPRALTCIVAVALVAALAGLAAFARIEPKEFAEVRAQSLAARHGVTIAEVRTLLPDDLATAAAEHLRIVGERMFIIGLGLAAAAIFAHVNSKRERARVVWLPLFAVVLVEGASFGAAYLAPRPSSEVFPHSASMDAIAKAACDGRVLRVDTSGTGIDDVLALARPNLVEAYGVSDLTPYVAFSQRALVELVSSIDRLATYRTGISRISYPALIDHRVLDVCHVTAILSRNPLQNARLEPLIERDGFHVYRRICPTPIARFVQRAVETNTDEEELGFLRQQTFDPAEVAVLAPGEHIAKSPSVGGFSGELTEFVDDRMGSIECRVATSTGGLAVFSIAYHPGWRAYVDGVATPVLRVDHACCGVFVPAGSSRRIELRFEPSSLAIGAFVSLAAIVAAWFVARRA